MLAHQTVPNKTNKNQTNLIEDWSQTENYEKNVNVSLWAFFRGQNFRAPAISAYKIIKFAPTYVICNQLYFFIKGLICIGVNKSKLMVDMKQR